MQTSDLTAEKETTFEESEAAKMETPPKMDPAKMEMPLHDCGFLSFLSSVLNRMKMGGVLVLVMEERRNRMSGWGWRVVIFFSFINDILVFSPFH